MSRSVAVGAVVGALSLWASGSAGAVPGQTLGIDYSPFGCPSQTRYAVAGAETTLVVSTATNAMADVYLEIPSRGLRVRLPTAFGNVETRVPLGVLEPSLMIYRFVAPPVTGSYGGTCQGLIQVN